MYADYGMSHNNATGHRNNATSHSNLNSLNTCHDTVLCVLASHAWLQNTVTYFAGITLMIHVDAMILCMT